MKLELILNGQARTLDIASGALLLDVLRREGFKGVKEGCREGSCGCCTVLLDGQPVYSCLLFAAQADGRSVTTIEGLGSPDAPHPIQEAFVDAGAVQCGYCAPGAILAAKALLDRSPSPGDSEILGALDGNLCRCTGYVKRVDAVHDASKRLRKSKGNGHGRS